MFEPQLIFFEIEVEFSRSNATETNKLFFCVDCRYFNLVDVSSFICKFVLAVINTQMLAVANINQAILTKTTIGAD